MELPFITMCRPMRSDRQASFTRGSGVTNCAPLSSNVCQVLRHFWRSLLYRFTTAMEWGLAGARPSDNVGSGLAGARPSDSVGSGLAGACPSDKGNGLAGMARVADSSALSCTARVFLEGFHFQFSPYKTSASALVSSKAPGRCDIGSEVFITAEIKPEAPLE